MKTKIKFISCILMLLIIAATGIWAQETPVSPTNEATAGLASTEADQFMSVLDWSKVKFDKVFTYADFRRYGYLPNSNIIDNNQFDLGAAFKAGPLYIGSWYRGRLGELFSEKENHVITELTESGGTITNKKETKTTQLDKTYDASHNAVVLLGFGNIGINLGYEVKGTNRFAAYTWNSTKKKYELQKDLITTNTSNSSTTETKYDPKSFLKRANHSPFIGFGMNIALGKLTLSPTALFKVTIDENAHKVNKTTIENAALYRKTTKKNEGYSHANVGINGKFGVDLGLGDSVNSSFNLGYDFTVRVYDKTYTDVSGAKHKIKGNYEIKTDELKDEYNVNSSGEHKVTKTFEPKITKMSYFTNTLNMGYKMQKDFDRLSLFAGIEAPISLTLDTQAEQQNSTTIEKVTHINPANHHNDYEQTTTTIGPIKTTKTTTIGVKPKLSLGLSYAAIPSKLFLNFGANVKVFGDKGYSTEIEQVGYNTHVIETVTTTTYKDGRVVKNTSASHQENDAYSKTTTKYAKAQVEANIGLRWQMVENVAFDASYSLIDNNISLFDRGNLKLACTIKF